MKSKTTQIFFVIALFFLNNLLSIYLHVLFIINIDFMY